MKTASLAQQAYDFHDHLLEIKNRTPLPASHLRWYPWISLAGMDALHQFLDGDVNRIATMTGMDPVLDVGCGDGDVAFFIESTLGLHVDCLDQPPSNYNAMYGVRELKRVLGSGIDIFEADVDAEPKLPRERYGFAFVLGILYHLKNPFLVLETLARHARYMFLSTRIASLSPDHKTNFGHLPMAYLLDADELNDDPTNFWIFTEAGLRRILQRSGWDVEHYETVPRDIAKSDPVTEGGDARAYLLAKSRHMRVTRGMELAGGWHQLEFGRQRWTERRFSVILDLTAAVAPAHLRFRFQLHEAVLAAQGGSNAPISLRASINGVALAPRVFSTAGWHEYVGQLESLEPGQVRVEFELDRALGPNSTDLRELGVVVDFGEGKEPTEPVELY